jgi:hypothetical protein
VVEAKPVESPKPVEVVKPILESPKPAESVKTVVDSPKPAAVIVPVAKKDEVYPAPASKPVDTAPVVLVKKTTVSTTVPAPAAAKAADAKTITSTTTAKTGFFKRPSFGLKGEALIAALKFK